MSRMLLSAFILVFLGFGALASTASASGHNCGNYDFQEDAQAAYNADTSDPNGLDGPPGPTSSGVPGKACEDLPSRGGGSGNGGETSGGGSEGDGEAEESDGGSADDMVDEVVGELPETGSGPKSSEGSSKLVTLFLVGSLLCVAVAGRLQFQTRQ